MAWPRQPGLALPRHPGSKRSMPSRRRSYSRCVAVRNVLGNLCCDTFGRICSRVCGVCVYVGAATQTRCSPAGAVVPRSSRGSRATGREVRAGLATVIGLIELCWSFSRVMFGIRLSLQGVARRRRDEVEERPAEAEKGRIRGTREQESPLSRISQTHHSRIDCRLRLDEDTERLSRIMTMRR